LFYAFTLTSVKAAYHHSVYIGSNDFYKEPIPPSMTVLMGGVGQCDNASHSFSCHQLAPLEALFQAQSCS